MAGQFRTAQSISLPGLILFLAPAWQQADQLAARDAAHAAARDAVRRHNRHAHGVWDEVKVAARD